MEETTSIANNLERVRERIASAAERAGRRPDEITLVAISKTFSAKEIRSAFDTGLHIFGENRVQECESKREMLVDLRATWHLIGHLQSNKARRAAHLFDRVDSIDTFALAQKLDLAAVDGTKKLEVLVEVHLGGEATKTGASERDLAAVVEGVAALSHLEFLGLMAIPPYADDPECARPYFRKLRELREESIRRIGRDLPVLSMGMSHDFETAIEEGATEIRVGTAIFGNRQTKTQI